MSPRGLKPARRVAGEIRRLLIKGGSAPHSQEVQRFFKEEVVSRGWYSDELRRMAARFRRTLLDDGGPAYLLAVADHLFRGRVLEEKNMAVFLLEKSVASFRGAEFKLFEQWLSRVSNWADHDALVSSLIGPMIAAEPERAARVFTWARSRDRWHRRAAAVALIRGVRQRMFLGEVVRVCNMLLADRDDMVQKGVGWLLREAVKCDPAAYVGYLLRIRDRAPRLVLRTACETLPPQLRTQVLGRKNSAVLPPVSRKRAAAASC